MSVGRICSREVVLADRAESAAVAARRMTESRVGSLVVRDDAGRPVGILTDRDLVRRVLAPGLPPTEASVGEVMTSRPQTVEESASIGSAIERMQAHGFRRLPVVDAEGRLVGLLALDDALALLTEEMTAIGRLLAKSAPEKARVALPPARVEHESRALGATDLGRRFREVMRRRLGERREAILRQVLEADADLQLLAQEREIELEERAQDEAARRLLLRLDERGRGEIARIDAALARIAEGRFGECLVCGERIPYARLQAVPTATNCSECAREAEPSRRPPRRPDRIDAGKRAMDSA